MTSFIDPNGNTDLLSGNEWLLILFPNTGPQALSYPCDKECAFASWLVEFGALPVSLVQRADHWPNKKNTPWSWPFLARSSVPRKSRSNTSFRKRLGWLVFYSALRLWRPVVTLTCLYLLQPLHAKGRNCCFWFSDTSSGQKDRKNIMGWLLFLHS